MSFSRSIDIKEAQKCHDYDHKEQHSYGVQYEAPPSLERDIDEFGRLLGVEFDFHGAQGNSVRLNTCVYEFLEDPDDGYRSHLGAIDYTDNHSSLFFSQSIAQVIIETYHGRNEEYSEGDQGYQLVDVEDGHVWLEFGTDNTDDYYPMFAFRHMPKEPK